MGSLVEDEALNKSQGMRTRIVPGSALASSLQKAKVVYMGEFASASGGFLATPGVFSCIAVAAWHPSGLGFLAHIDINAVHWSVDKLRAKRKKDRNTLYAPIPEFSIALAKTFESVNVKSEVRINLVGGQSSQDACQMLRKFTGNESFSGHVMQAVRNAGFEVGDVSMLNCFPSVPITLTSEVEQHQKGFSFCLVALDVGSGAIVTQTLPDHPFTYVVDALGAVGVEIKEKAAALFVDFFRTGVSRHKPLQCVK